MQIFKQGIKILNDMLMVQHEDKVAALILTPYHPATFAPSELPVEGFWEEVESLCSRYGTLLVLDDVWEAQHEAILNFIDRSSRTSRT